MKTLYCESCKIVVAKIKEGSSLKKDMVVLCGRCELKRKASDLASKTSKSPFGDIFGGLK